MDFIDEFKQYILSVVPTARSASGGAAILCRCFECPDSSDPRNAHFYFIMPKYKGGPIKYYCHKCHCNGDVTYDKLIEWDIFDPDIGEMLIEYNKGVKSSNRYTGGVKKINYIFNNYTKDDDNTRIKLDYINNRLGTNYNYEDLRQLKIVLNLYDILNQNHISNLTRDPQIVEALNYNFLGFLSIDNSFLNMRRLCKEGLVHNSIDKRYINYQLFGNDNDFKRFYTIPSVIDLNNPNPINIHIAEGPFDILSIYENVRHREYGIYTSVAGSNYGALAMYFLGNYKIPNAIVHLYPDNDKSGSINKLRSIISYLKYIGIDVYIHRNTYDNEKDFGVSSDRIKESIMKA